MQAKNLGTFKELLCKITNLKQHVIVGVCPELMYVVTKVAPSEQQTAQAPVAKRPHDGAEMSPQKKLRKDEGREQEAPRKETTPRSAEERHHQRADEVSRKVRKAHGREHRDISKLVPQKKSVAFNDCFLRLKSLAFSDDISVLTQLCTEFALPVLSREQFMAYKGEKLRVLGEGGFGKAFLNKENGLVMKLASSINSYRSFILEAMVMKLFAEYRSGFQSLVGLCPEKLGLVTKDAGISLDRYMCDSNLDPNHKFSILTQLCKILSDLHQHGFVHNDVKPQNVCLRMTASGPVVTLIDFGITMLTGWKVGLDTAWNASLPYAPEICGRDSGACSRESDTFSVGQLLRCLFDGTRLPPLLSSWHAKSQSRHPSERSNLSLLVKFVEEQRLSHQRFGR
ncbi:serine/threonine-protein kinase pkn2-like [Penaeus vannamei]|uniref:serine/threonine-protein kinase pkn2-like n=1 Tax=Penaeus vannamei TaxID=6689 RepID=UPI00387F60AC